MQTVQQAPGLEVHQFAPQAIHLLRSGQQRVQDRRKSGAAVESRLERLGAPQKADFHPGLLPLRCLYRLETWVHL